VVGREHRADRGDDDVERRVLERQVLGVSLDPCDRDADGLRPAPARVEQLRRQVARRDVRAGLRRRDRRVRGAGGDIEDAHARADAAGRDEPRTQREQPRLDHRPRPTSPDGAP
jgi:hypothetical protein